MALTDSISPKRLLAVDLVADFRQGDVRDIGQFVGGGLRDADGDDIAVELVPFVGCEIPAIGGEWACVFLVDIVLNGHEIKRAGDIG